MSVEFFRAGKVSEIDPSKIFRCRLDGMSVLVVSTPEGFRAFENRCTHADVALHAGKYDAQTCELTCPAHSAIFKLTTGEAIHGPAFMPLQFFATEVRREGDEDVLWVGLDTSL